MTTNKLAIGIDLGGTMIKFAVVNFNGAVVAESSVETRAEQGPPQVMAQMKKGVRELLAQYPDYRSSLVGIGVGAAGMVDQSKGIVRFAPNFRGWKNVEVGPQLEAEFGLPVRADNDANVAALAEGRFGAGVGYSDFLLITLGTGVGGGLLLNGEIYVGSGGAAGEIGHLTVDIHGPRCNCGNYGCLERFVGANGITERARQKLTASTRDSLLRQKTDSLTPKDIGLAAADGDELAKEVLRETGEILGTALASVLNLLNLPLIIIGGGIARAGDPLLQPTIETIHARALPIAHQGVRVVTARLGNAAGVIGAACLVMEKDDPIQP